MSDIPEVHPALEPLRFLLGAWRGEGRGLWAADPPFRYREEAQFTAPPGKPFLVYAQRTWAADDGRPMHMETGYLRPGDGKTLEFVIAQPTGFAEVQTGSLDGQRLRLAVASLGKSPSALNVTGIERDVWREGDTIRYLVRMAMNGEPLADHLAATLHLTAASLPG
ncbi:MAG: nitrobindin family protein [Chloroflexota bacterium]